MNVDSVAYARTNDVNTLRTKTLNFRVNRARSRGSIRGNERQTDMTIDIEIK